MSSQSTDQDRICKQRIEQVFEYLKALNEHRNPTIRRVQEHSWLMWLDNLPGHPFISLPRHLASVLPQQAEELPDREFEMAEGETFYVIVEAYIVESNIAELPPAGSTLYAIFTFDFDPTNLGRSENLGVIWFDFGGGFFPFLNEGVLMTNVRLLR